MNNLKLDRNLILNNLVIQGIYLKGHIGEANKWHHGAQRKLNFKAVFPTLGPTPGHPRDCFYSTELEVFVTIITEEKEIKSV